MKLYGRVVGKSVFFWFIFINNVVFQRSDEGEGERGRKLSIVMRRLDRISKLVQWNIIINYKRIHHPRTVYTSISLAAQTAKRIRYCVLLFSRTRSTYKHNSTRVLNRSRIILSSTLLNYSPSVTTLGNTRHRRII